MGAVCSLGPKNLIAKFKASSTDVIILGLFPILFRVLIESTKFLWIWISAFYIWIIILTADKAPFNDFTLSLERATSSTEVEFPT